MYVCIYEHMYVLLAFGLNVPDGFQGALDVEEMFSFLS